MRHAVLACGLILTLAGCVPAPHPAIAETAPAEPGNYACKVEGAVPGGTLIVTWNEFGPRVPTQYRMDFYTPYAADMQLHIRWYGDAIGPVAGKDFAIFRFPAARFKRGTTLQLWRADHLAGQAAMSGGEPNGPATLSMPVGLDELWAMAAGKTELTLVAVDKYRIPFKRARVPTALFSAANAIPEAVRAEAARLSADYRHLCEPGSTDIVVT